MQQCGNGSSKESLFAAFGSFAAGLLAACLSVAPTPARADPERYNPTMQDFADIGGVWGALRSLRAQIDANTFALCQFVGRGSGFPLTASVTGNGISVKCSDSADQFTFNFGAWTAYAMSDRRLMLCQATDGRVMYTRPARNPDQVECRISVRARGVYDREELKRFAVAWALLSEVSSGIHFPSDEQFLASVAAAPMDDAAQERIRRVQVQVELAIRENRREDAAQLYTNALNEAPGWADGQFNQALLLGELELYRGAIMRMHNYLLLAPNAPDARAAQDKIYEWEARVPRMAP